MPESTTNSKDPANAAGRIVRSSTGIITMGVLTALAGVAILAWPDATIKVIAVVFGLFVLVNGVFRLVSALAAEGPAGGSRVLLALLGVVSILVGILILRHPFQTLAVVTLLLGMYWVVSGVVELVHALGSPGIPGRGWAIGAGSVTLIAGIVLLAYTSASVTVLVWLAGLELLVCGGIAVAWGISARHERVLTAPGAVTPA